MVAFLVCYVFLMRLNLFSHRTIKDLRCIIFVERVISAMVLANILDHLLSQTCGWRVRYIAGNQSALKTQSRKDQNKIVEEFRKGAVSSCSLSWHCFFFSSPLTPYAYMVFNGMM